MVCLIVRMFARPIACCSCERAPTRAPSGCAGANALQDPVAHMPRDVQHTAMVQTKARTEAIIVKP